MTPSGTGPAVEATGLVKEFEKGRRTLWQRLRGEKDQRERFRAVDGIDLRVERGEIFGVLGPNGAGKTTTIRMPSTLLEPTDGTARSRAATSCPTPAWCGAAWARCCGPAAACTGS